MSDEYEQHYPYQLGDISPEYDDDDVWCGMRVANEHNWICTRPDGHAGPHVAHGGDGRVLAIDPPCPDYLMVSEGL